LPEVHLPDVDEIVDPPPPHAAAVAASTTPSEGRSHRSRTVVKVLLEVVLISAGVFLGLMGEQWRETADHRDLAETSLRRLRTEIATNRKAVAAQTDYHAKLFGQLRAFLAAAPSQRASLSVGMTQGLGPVFFERGAWDLALATGAMAYIDADLAFELSRVYTQQNAFADMERAIIQSTAYRPGFLENFESDARALVSFFGDAVYIDPILLEGYDSVLKAIDRELAE
jgi:hypothetical protein